MFTLETNFTFDQMSPECKVEVMTEEEFESFKQVVKKLLEEINESK